MFGPAREIMPEPLTRLVHAQRLNLLGLTFEVIDVPGHTSGHIAYYCDNWDGAPILFCGDTLFSGGCGRLFEGTAEQMQASLASLAALPGTTRVCCAHEYTLSNLKFAVEVEPDNLQLLAYRDQCLALREQDLPTLPSTVEIERHINPFLRSEQPTILASVRRFDADSVARDGAFSALRQWKNQYR